MRAYLPARANSSMLVTSVARQLFSVHRGRLLLMSEMEASSAVAALGRRVSKYIGTIALVERYLDGVEH
jgi:hypothetical protein